MGDAEQLRQLVELFESGALSEAEFAAAKRRLLGIDDGDVPDSGAGDSTPDALRAPGEVEAAPPTDDGPSVPDDPPGGPAAGWYSDPWDDHAERYWDGEHWTDRVSHAGTQATASTKDAETPPSPGGAPMSYTPEQLERLNRYERHVELLCLECGFQGLMGVADEGKPQTWVFRWPGILLAIILMALFLPLGWLTGLLVGAFLAIGISRTTRATLHCPNCDQLIEERK